MHANGKKLYGLKEMERGREREREVFSYFCSRNDKRRFFFFAFRHECYQERRKKKIYLNSYIYSYDLVISALYMKLVGT